MLKVIAWNIVGREPARKSLLDSDVDVALFQEAAKPPDYVAQKISVGTAPWRTDSAGLSRPWRTVVVKLSENVSVEWLEPKAIVDARPRGDVTRLDLS